MTSDSLVIRGAREHNLKNVSLELPARAADRVHRAVGFGQVVLGLRHHLRRGPAALCRIAVGLRPAVPRADGQARRRLHRGAVAGDLDRSEDRLPQPPFDGGDRHRDPRLSAVDVGPDRDSPLSDARPAGHARPPSRSSTRSCELPEGTRFQVLAPVVQGTQGRVRDASQGLAGRALPGPRIDGELRELTEDIRLDRYFQHSIEVVVDRLVRKEGIQQRLTESLETGSPPGRGRGRDRGDRRSHPHLLPAPGLPLGRLLVRGTAASQLLASTAPTAPARSARESGPATRSTPNWWFPTPTARFGKAPSLPGRA